MTRNILEDFEAHWKPLNSLKTMTVGVGDTVENESL